MVALPPPSRQNLFFKRTGNPVLLQSLDFKRSDKAEEQSERGIRYEVERDTGRGESTRLFIVFESGFPCLRRFSFFCSFCVLRLCSLFRFLVLVHFGYSFSVSLINKISTILRTRKDLGEFVFSFGPRTGQARRGSPLFPVLDMDGHQ